MKTLADGTTVIARTYYYLLDWNEWNNWDFMVITFNKIRLGDLNIKEYKILWAEAIKSDTNQM